MLGVKRNSVVLAPHDETWKALYEEARSEIREILGGNILDVQHVGSTAIHGIAAKPILDIAVVVRSAAAINFDGMLVHGYQYAGEAGVPGRFFFARYKGQDISTHHIHCYEPGNPDLSALLAFRDYLNEHPDYARSYNALKLRLAAKYPDDRVKYTQEKTDFIQMVCRLANCPVSLL